jgi:predicted HicB family RNase H-like nuclease
MERQQVTLSIRLPRELHEQLKHEAEREERSLNNLIVRALRTWLVEREGPGATRDRQ